VEEEVEGELMEVQPCDGGVGGAVDLGVTQVQDDDEGDTLSEISEIHTLAEDVGPKSNKSTAKVSKKEKTPAPKTEIEATKAPTKPAPTETPATSVPTVAKKTVEAPSEKSSVAPEDTSKPAVVKKKVVKPKVVAEEAKAKEETPLPKPQVEIKPKPEPEVPNKATVPVEEKKAPAAAPSVVTTVAPAETPKPAPTAIQATPDSSDKEGADSAAEKKKKLIRQRSGSVGEVSPTRVERRNSKVISQKTAELIQNLETKTGTSSGGEGSGSGGEGGNSKVASRPPGIKKLVIPSFKVSDAKNKFETKPPRPIVSSVMSLSKAAFEAKAQQSAKPPVESKSVSEAASAKPAAAASTAAPKPAAETKTAEPPKPKIKEEEVPKTEEAPKVKEDEPKPKETPAAVEKKPAVVNAISTLAPNTPESPAKSPGTSPKTKPKVVKKPASTAEEKPTEPEPKPSVAKIPAKVEPSVQPEQEVKPVLIDTGKGAPKAVSMVVKGRTTPTPTSPTPPPVSSPTPTPTTTPTPAVESPPKNKELAAKKISSVINKIVSSSSTDETKFVPPKKEASSVSTPTVIKTEVSFPISAAQSQERMIPIKFVEEDDQNNRPTSPPASSSMPTSTTTSRTSIAGSGGRFPPARFDSFKRFDSSASSLFSRQNSASDTESCTSMAPPPKHEAIRKSPREFLIPIKLEGSGQTVTPKEDVVSEASEDDFRMDSRLRSGRFGRHKRYSSLLSDSSLDEEPSVSISTAGVQPAAAAASANQSRRASTASSAVGSVHARSRSQGDEPETPTSTFKRYRYSNLEFNPFWKMVKRER
jgi:hypothetical protein